MDPFYWGLATSAFQMEGFVQNDMTQWEALGGFRQDGKNPLYQNGAAHWQYWQEDYRLLASIGVNAYRFSMEWARIEPKRGHYDQKSLDHYERMLDTLLKMGIEPFLTLHHFTHPVWFHAQTPWTSEAAQDVFCSFAEMLIKRFASKINYWITFNEPLVWVLAAYGDAKFPPGKNNVTEMIHAFLNILKTHACVYDRIKSARPLARVGLAKHFIVFAPGRKWFAADRSLADLLHGFFNKMTLDAFKLNRLKFRFPFLFNFDEPVVLNDKIDFWGVNYYYRMYSAFKLNFRRPIHFFFKDAAGHGLTDMGWEIYPKGLGQILKAVARSGKDIFITENGIATTDEALRMRFMDEHIRQILSARQNGLPVRGYFYWTFLDNYEWLEGKSKRFGLVHVDYANDFARKVKPSAEHYARMIAGDCAGKAAPAKNKI
ncbi:MAG TPA: glycoside hydrolase family 1 protein [Bacteroidetes bacterium]|nr:beta-glucosidase A [bacterium BMS3Bbin03]HDK35918.1 glycoside hydrolase family 1 protein [Bacteroidota bacterium]HDZ11069.1 glycoside hydrolase family 1 protein [Bacteroidota bacterium]